MNDITPALKALHETYEHFTGYKLQFSFERLHAWELWQAKGWGRSELLLVLAFLRESIQKRRCWKGALSFHCLIEKRDIFEEYLAEARARGRIPKIDRGKAEVLKATGRMEELKAKPRSAVEILRDEKAFEDFRAFARSL